MARSLIDLDVGPWGPLPRLVLAAALVWAAVTTIFAGRASLRLPRRVWRRIYNTED